jgi:NAD(P)-dependent dehydrogenase (short-subunit alcohol dehydrogenase family)
MQNKVALITGAKGGLGTFVTETFLGAGLKIAGVSRSIAQADFSNPNFHAFPADITQPRSTRDLVQAVVAKLARIDVLVHVTGGFAAAKIHETDDDTWLRMRDLNLSSGFYVAREVIPVMRRQKHGRIIAIGSLAAVEPHAALGAYASFKTALAMLFRTIAIENQDAGITSNIILPGTMDTPANRAAMPNADPTKWLPPGDVAKLALWLASDEDEVVNGAVIPISREA